MARTKYDRLHDRIDKLHDSRRRGPTTTAELMEQARHAIHVFIEIVLIRNIILF